MKSLRVFLKESDENKLSDKYSLMSKIAEVGNKKHLDKLLSADVVPGSIRAAIAKRGFKEHLDKLVNDPNPLVRSMVATHGHPEHLDKLVDDPSSGVVMRVAGHGRPQDMNKLINHEDSGVLSMVAAHTTNPRHIERLAAKDNSSIRSGLIRNKATPEFILDRIAAGGGHMLNLIANNRQRQVNSVAKDPSTRYDTGQLIAQYGNDENRHHLITNFWNRSSGVLTSAAQYGNASHRDRLIHHPDVATRAGVVSLLQNKEELERLKDDPSAHVKLKVFDRAKTLNHDDIARHIVRNASAPAYLEALAYRPGISKEELLDIAKKENNTSETKERIISQGDDRHHEITSKDKDPRIRAITANHASVTILNRLINDPDQHVRDTANKWKNLIDHIKSKN